MDAIEAAIAATQTSQPERRAELRVGLASGGVVAINVPVDLDASETVHLIGYVALQLPVELANLREPASRLLVPTHAIARS